jgi:hypothetical protein
MHNCSEILGTPTTPKMNGAELDIPIKALQQNAQYREARELMADEVQRLNKLLSPT